MNIVENEAFSKDPQDSKNLKKCHRNTNPLEFAESLTVHSSIHFVHFLMAPQSLSTALPDSFHREYVVKTGNVLVSNYWINDNHPPRYAASQGPDREVFAIDPHFESLTAMYWDRRLLVHAVSVVVADAVRIKMAFYGDPCAHLHVRDGRKLSVIQIQRDLPRPHDTCFWSVSGFDAISCSTISGNIAAVFPEKK